MSAAPIRACPVEPSPSSSSVPSPGRLSIQTPDPVHFSPHRIGSSPGMSQDKWIDALEMSPDAMRSDEDEDDEGEMSPPEVMGGEGEEDSDEGRAESERVNLELGSNRPPNGAARTLNGQEGTLGLGTIEDEGGPAGLGIALGDEQRGLLSETSRSRRMHASSSDGSLNGWRGPSLSHLTPPAWPAPHDFSDLQPYSFEDPLADRSRESLPISRCTPDQSSDASSTSDLSASSLRMGGGGTYLSVANGPMGRYAAENGPVANSRAQQTSRSPRAFFSNLLGRSPRRPSNPTASTSSSTPPTASTSRPSTPTRGPIPTSDQTPTSPSRPHLRSSSMPSPELERRSFSPVAESRSSLDVVDESMSAITPPQRRTPLSMAVATFSGLTRSGSLRSNSSPGPASPSTLSTSRGASGPTPSALPPPPLPATLRPPAPVATSSPTIAASPMSIGFSTPPATSTMRDFDTLRTPESIGLGLVSLTHSLPISRHAQPLCGAILDDKYLLIGTTAGLDFLPLPVPGSVSSQLNGKKQKDTRKPIQLIKRTRFKELAVLSERSNILLAIAGRNDHVRVYALEGIRSMIAKAMAALEARNGYPYIADGKAYKAGKPPGEDPKGKRKATAAPTQQDFRGEGPDPYRFPTTSPPPPDYSMANKSESEGGAPTPPTPQRAPVRRQPSSALRPGLRHTPSANVVRAVPTNPRSASFSGPSTSSSANAINAFGAPSSSPPPRSLRGQKSRDFVATRRNSSATIVAKRRSRGDLSRHSPTLSNSRRSSLVSATGGSGIPTRFSASEMSRNNSDAGLDPLAGDYLRVGNGFPSTSRRGSATSLSGWGTSASVSPAMSSTQRMEPRESPVLSRRASLPKSPSQTAELASFLRTTGPEVIPSPTVGALNGDWVQVSAVEQTPKKVVAREATMPRLRVGETSPTMMLADFIRDSGPTENLRVPRRRLNSTSSESALAERRESALPRLPPDDGEREPAAVDRIRNGSVNVSVIDSTRSSACLNGGGVARPMTADSALPRPFGAPGPNRRLVARGAKTIASPDTSPELERDDDDAPRPTRRGMTLTEIIRDDPPPTPAKSNMPSSRSVPNGLLAPRSASPSVTSRTNKRWTMSAVGSKLLSRPGATSDAPSATTSRPSTADGRASSSSASMMASGSGNGIPRSTSAPVIAGDAAQQRPLPPTPTAEEDSGRDAGGDFKPRPKAALDPAGGSAPPKVAPTTRMSSDSHPAAATSPLDYVKLARTKGARLLRAVETKKRTYLAVLGGDEGDRIELFTGSRGISLSLNRTFVLPERPRTIEFQLQGDDLVDIYLIYSESIFALEPATVRVREVGVGRGERRARRERERRMRDLAASASEQVEGSVPAGGVLDPASTPHPADHAAGSRRSPTPDSGPDQTPRERAGDVTPPRPAFLPAELVSTATGDTLSPSTPLPRDPPRSRSPTPSPNVAEGRDTLSESPSAVPPRTSTSSNAPYTTFQQLPFIPPVPSSILASAWTIPPLYTDVVGADADAAVPDPPFSIPTALHSNQGLSSSARTDAPLLSPISLLGPAAHRSSGPPGLFFVTKGSNLSGIVTADGKSVIKRPLVWSEAPVQPDTDAALNDEPHRIEMLIRNGTRTVVVGIARSGVKAIAVGGEEPDEPPFGCAVSIAPAYSGGAREGKEMTWLGTHAASGQLFFAERAGSNFAVRCLFAKYEA